MKTLKKKMMLVFVLFVFFNGNIFAKDFYDMLASEEHGSTAPSSSGVPSAAGSTPIGSSSTVLKDCSEGNNFLSFATFKKLLVDKHDLKIGIETNKKEEVKLIVEVPTHLRPCVDIQLIIQPVKKPSKKGFFVSAKNRFFDNLSETEIYEIFGKMKGGFGDARKNYESLTQDQRLKQCLKNKKYIKTVKKKKIIDHKGEFQKHKGPFETNNFYKVDDINDIYGYFLTPKREDEVGTLAAKVDSPFDCFHAENFTIDEDETPLKDSTYLHWEELLDMGDGSCQEDACKRRRYNSALGGFNDNEFLKLNKDTQDILIAAVDGYRDDLGDELIKELKEKSGQIKSATSRDEVDELGDEYMDLVAKYENNVFKPLLEELKLMYRLRKKAIGKKNKNNYDKRIKELNKKIGKFARTTNAKRVLRKFEKYDLSSKAEDVSKMLLTSSHYARVNHAGRGKLTPKRADGRIKHRQKKYVHKDLVKAHKVYDARTTGRRYSNSYYNEAAGVERMSINASRRFHEKENQMRRSCQYNPVRCKFYYAGMSRRYARYREQLKYHQKLKNKHLRSAEMFKSYEREGRRNMLANRDFYYGDTSLDILDFSLYGENMLDTWDRGRTGSMNLDSYQGYMGDDYFYNSGLSGQMYNGMGNYPGQPMSGRPLKSFQRGGPNYPSNVQHLQYQNRRSQW